MIILLCRNNVELSKQCMTTLLAQSPPKQILVINNASTDDSGKWMWNLERTFTKWCSPQKSVAHCWNWGLEWVFKHGHQEALVVNNDTELRPDTYALLRETLRAAPTVGMATCVSIRESERLYGGVKFRLEPDAWRPHPDFSCFMIAKWAYEKVGPFDERYEIAYAEDADYHVRMHRAGVEAINIGLPFLHHGSQTVKQADELERKLICEAADRNRQLFFDTYGVRIGSDEYSSLFTEESFGCDAIEGSVAEKEYSELSVHRHVRR